MFAQTQSHLRQEIVRFQLPEIDACKVSRGGGSPRPFQVTVSRGDGISWL
jgi:predicted S18 family serine protease